MNAYCIHKGNTKLRSRNSLQGNLVRATRHTQQSQTLKKFKETEMMTVPCHIRSREGPGLYEKQGNSICSFIQQIICWACSAKGQARVSVPDNGPEQQPRSECVKTPGPEQVKWITGNYRSFLTLKVK